MKKSLSTLPFLLLSFFLTSAIQAQDECPEGFEKITLPDGEVVCQLIYRQCIGGNKWKFVDSQARGTRLCCYSTSQLVIYDNQTRVGVCCDEGKVYMGTKPDGKCCPPNSVLNADKECIPAT
ncbi:hypothetical protein E1B28_013806 [Marasmius oreades]|uniref:Uncharacterized protein n=1 Tax=Marasmius oreades TaxID=181124 RepID=A0A9P7RRR3_9AGAR|nr:uncharacterized protein E1B28_013806 [Marasmius oreades]KAG7087868.1 hypothetical protein E1B28_013806 [Marasmius oreades]